MTKCCLLRTNAVLKTIRFILNYGVSVKNYGNWAVKPATAVTMNAKGIRSGMSRLRDRATTLEIQINAELFDSAHVIASTLVSSNHRLLNGRRFGTLFIDEAAQALEAACWIAIRKADG